MSSPIIVNIVIPFLLFFIYLLIARTFLLILKNRELALGFALAIPMTLPYVVSGILQRPIGVGFTIATIATILAILYFLKRKYRTTFQSGIFFTKTDIISILIVITLCCSILMPGLYSDGYFIPNANFDFIIV